MLPSCKRAFAAAGCSFQIAYIAAGLGIVKKKEVFDMPAAVRKAAISFGMVYIPVSLYTAVQEKGIGFNQLTLDGVRVRQKKVREDTGAEVSASDIVKGYEYARGQYVVITDDEMEKLKSERDKAINILHFTTPESIPSVYFDKSYLVAPDGSDKAYELLRRAMLERGVIGIAKSVLWSRETMMALIPEENGIRMQTLFYQNQIKYAPMASRHAEVSEAELNMGKMLVDSMVRPYQPALYRDEYEEKLLSAIQRKVEGKEIIAAPQQHETNVIDLMDALQRSLAQQEVKRSDAEAVPAGVR